MEYKENTDGLCTYLPLSSVIKSSNWSSNWALWCLLGIYMFQMKGRVPLENVTPWLFKLRPLLSGGAIISGKEMIGYSTLIW